MLIFTGALGAGLCYLLMITAQRKIDPVAFVLMLSAEPVVAMFLSLVIPDASGRLEILKASGLLGCAFIMGGIVLSRIPGIKGRKKINGNSKGEDKSENIPKCEEN